MQHFKEEVVPAQKKRVHTHTTCDLCGENVDPEYSYDIDEVTISYRHGVAYPEGGSGHEIEIDMCGKCFKEKLLDWFEFIGAKVRMTEWDY